MAAISTPPPVEETEKPQKRLETMAREGNPTSIDTPEVIPEPPVTQNTTITLYWITPEPYDPIIDLTPSGIPKELRVPSNVFNFIKNFKKYHRRPELLLSPLRYMMGYSTKPRQDNKSLYVVIYNEKGVAERGGFYETVKEVRKVYKRFQSELSRGWMRICDFARDSPYNENGTLWLDSMGRRGSALANIDDYFQGLGYHFKIADSPHPEVGGVELVPTDPGPKSAFSTRVRNKSGRMPAKLDKPGVEQLAEKYSVLA